VRAIGAAVGCSTAMVREVLLDPERRASYNTDRRAHWRVYRGGRAA
jgi:hypothetical protein